MGLLLWLVVLVATVLVLMGIWGDARDMLRVAATAGLVALVGSFLAMARQR